MATFLNFQAAPRFLATAVGLLGDRSFKLAGEDAVNYHIPAGFCRLARL
jgi:hypothetical protein